MRRNFISVFVAYAVALVSVTPDLNAQFAPAYPNGQYPQSSQQAPYPVQGYPQGQPYPQAQGYPQGQYPQQAGNMDAEGVPDPQADRQHGVARISVLQGDVNLRRGDTGELVAAVMNAPVSGQDHLQTAPGSFAEVQLDAGNIVRLAPNTDLGFADLQYRRYQVQLGAGTVIYRVLRDINSQAEIDTPSIAVRPTTQGEYRISVLEDGTTQITVRAGQAEIYSPRGTQTLGPGQTMLVRGDPASPEFQSGYEIARDGFDGWSESRDQRLLASQSYRYVSQDVYGADDLDAYGNWVPSQYGQVWQPRPPYEGWSPYSYGQWDWTNYYGWTWVDSSPWGWAPYHYGRWFQSGGAWCWWPGARGEAFGWSPALVGFFGLGAVAGAILSGIGWAALAPFEAFHSWWGRSAFGYGRGGVGFGFGYNRGLYRNGAIAGMYRNAAFRGGAMSASLGRFSGPGQHFSAVGESQLRGASAFRGQIPISATRGSRQFSERQAFANPHLASAGNRQFFQHQQSSSFSRGGFTQTQRTGQTQQGFGSFAGGNRGAEMAQNSRNSAPNTRAPQQGQQYGSTGRSSTGGWQRFGDPGAGSSNFTGSRSNAGSSGSESGWHRFGDSGHSPSSYGPSYGAGGSANNNRSTQQHFYSAPSAPSNNRGYSSPGSGNQYRSPGNSSAMGSRQSFSAPGGSFNYGGGGRSTFNEPRVNGGSSFSAPRMNSGGGSSNFGGFGGSRSAPQQHFSAPSAPHYSAPSSRGGGGSFGGGGSSHGGGGSSHSSGGGHSSSSGHHGR